MYHFGSPFGSPNPALWVTLFLPLKLMRFPYGVLYICYTFVIQFNTMKNAMNANECLAQMTEIVMIAEADADASEMRKKLRPLITLYKNLTGHNAGQICCNIMVDFSRAWDDFDLGAEPDKRTEFLQNMGELFIDFAGAELFLNHRKHFVK